MDQKADYKELPNPDGEEGFKMQPQKDAFLGGGGNEEFSESERKKPRLPTTMEFRIRMLRMRKFEKKEIPPDMPENPQASDIAKYGEVDWEHIKHKQRRESSGDLATYLHGLAKMMSSREGYVGTDSANKEEVKSLWVSDEGATPHIRVRDDWSVGYDGNHRALALKILGPEYVKKSGMDEWVKIIHSPKENNNNSK